MNSILQVEGLSIVYKTDFDTVHAVRNISFSLDKGKTLGIVGETGAGKTTTARAINRLLSERTGRVTGGKILFDGRDILSLSRNEMHALRGDRISMVFQDPMSSLNPVMTVAEQILEPLIYHNHKRESRSALEKRVVGFLEMVGIAANRKNDYPHQFSGGMKQRAAIAIALACQPDLLIADEPTTALDVTIQAQVLLLMRGLRDQINTSMIMITHDLGIVAMVCDDVAIMYAGEIVEIGTAQDIFTGKKHHPYTVGLFGSIPNIKEKSRRLYTIDGLMPDPTVVVEGCSFAPRCPHRTARCDTNHPKFFTEGTHHISCHLFHEGN